MNKKIILASSSPRRIELLCQEGFDVTVIPANVSETVMPDWTPENTVENLSYQKASHVKKIIGADPSYQDFSIRNIPIIGADTVVFLNEIIGKPRDRNDALAILMSLSAKKHQVFTGVTILSSISEKEVIFSEKTDVYFKAYSERDLYEYLNTDEPYDKAGAYAVQGYFSRFIDHIEGEYTNVIGLPVKSLCSAISDF